MNKNLYYLFNITLSDGSQFFLNSSNDDIIFNGIIYSYYSSLNIKEAFFNDSSQNYVKLEGIYEEKAISNDTELKGAKFLIYQYNDFTKESNLYLEYYYDSHINCDDGYFIITLVPISYKLYQNLLKVFTKTCRATFGDKSCGISISNYKQIYEIESVENNIVILKNSSKESGYFDGGILSFENFSKKFTIEKHNENLIKLSEDIPYELLNKNYVELHPICNKEFISCCKLFNNAVNFRGEPFAPTSINLLK
jgi:uncharacterized phage protein (TIGR02218 family)